jgi:transposase-like protein
MMRERGLSVDHITIFRWVQQEKVLPSDCKLRRVKYLNNVTLARSQIYQKEVASDAGGACRTCHTA